MRFHWGRYGAAYAVREDGLERMKRRNRGRFATGHKVPEAGKIHWGRFGLFFAAIDCYRLNRKHKVS